MFNLTGRASVPVEPVRPRRLRLKHTGQAGALIAERRLRWVIVISCGRDDRELGHGTARHTPLRRRFANAPHIRM